MSLNFWPFNRPRLPAIINKLDKAQVQLATFSSKSNDKARAALAAHEVHTENAKRSGAIASAIANLTA